MGQGGHPHAGSDAEMSRQDVYSGEPWVPQGGREGEGRSGAQPSPERGLKEAALQRRPELGVGLGVKSPHPLVIARARMGAPGQGTQQTMETLGL